jgi:hypothetical protein
LSVVVTDFLHSLARDLVVRAAAASVPVTIAYPATPSASTPAGLWTGKAIEAYAADPYTVLRITGGAGTTWDPLPRLSVQFWTVGKGGPVAALNRAQTLFEALLDADGRPARMRVIDGFKWANDAADGHWLVVSIDPLQRPGPLGPDANGREQVSFNCDIGFVRKD